MIVGDHVTVNYAGGPRPELDGETVRALRSLIDRTHPSSALCKAVQQRLGRANQRPLVCVIPGFDIDRHEYFLRRYHDALVPDEMTVALNQEKIVRTSSHRFEKLAWQPDFYQLDDLIYHAHKAICSLPIAKVGTPADTGWFKRLFPVGKNRGNAAAPATYDIINQFYKLGTPYSFRYRVTESCWSGTSRQILSDWIDYWHRAPAIESDYFLSAIICLVYPDDASHPTTKAMRSFVDQLRRDNAYRDTLVVLDDLSEIFWDDADAWIYNHVQDKVPNMDTEDLRRNIQTIFDEQPGGKRLGAICEALKAALNRAYYT
ncbi:hypothetical protein [Exilibacterium tricleocarpae]|nr:hypothetical protein [Exilibacterium tricleocarpae]